MIYSLCKSYLQKRNFESWKMADNSMQLTDNKKFIDIGKVLEDKGPVLYKILPGFLINALRRLIHEDEINSFISRNSHLSEFEFNAQILQEFRATLEVSGIEHIPKEGGCVIAANHPLGGLDAIALIHAVAAVRRDIKFIVNDVLLQIENLQNIFTGVNKFGKNKLGTLNTIDDLYKSNSVILVFPAGLVSRRHGGKIKDLDWKKSFISKARKNNLPIIPTFIGGRNSNRFYNVSNWWKKVGGEINIEMALLPDEMYRKKGKTIPIIFGNPVILDSKESKANDQAIALKMMNQIYELASQKNILNKYT
jgi:putative hemolysin